MIRRLLARLTRKRSAALAATMPSRECLALVVEMQARAIADYKTACEVYVFTRALDEAMAVTERAHNRKLSETIALQRQVIDRMKERIAELDGALEARQVGPFYADQEQLASLASQTWRKA